MAPTRGRKYIPPSNADSGGKGSFVRRSRWSVLASGFAICVLASASSSSCTRGPEAAAAAPLQANPPSTYVAKLKNILVGLPPSDDEVKVVEADPTQLRPLIDAWMDLPQYSQKMLVFFELAFQQTQVSIDDFLDQTYPRPAGFNTTTAPKLAQNARESFARTVLQLFAEDSSLVDAFTTQRFMMTPALMELYAFLDTWQVDDAGAITDRFSRANPGLTITVEAAQGPIPIAQTLDPASANYMRWYDPDVVDPFLVGPDCAEDPIVYPTPATPSEHLAQVLHHLLLGTLITRTNRAGHLCLVAYGSAAAPQLAASDFDTWKMVTIRTPAEGEATTAFYDLPTLRSSSELVVASPRIGFFTPAFFANWRTNASNQMRVTANQALIVATGAAVDGTDPTRPSSTPGLEATHAASPDCVGCHRTLDPTRSILAATYSWSYHDQTDPAYRRETGLFSFQGVTEPVSSLADFARTLASHPLFASAWAQKLCYYVNSSACEASDPEFQRVVGLFKNSGYSWKVLVRELLASPLTTHASPTQTSIDGEVVAVSRRDHLCAALNFRLGLIDLCGLNGATEAAAQTAVPLIVTGLPSDGYGRGAAVPVLPNDPTLFFRAGTENVCEAVAALVIDNPAPETATTRQWSSTEPEAAIADFVHIVMALTASDARAAPAQALLQTHFAAALQSGEDASDALKSTFVAACLAPSSVSIGL